MPSAVAEAEAAAMDNAVDVWRLNTASRLHYAAPRRMRRAVAPTKEWDGCTMKDPFELLREASEAYNNDLRPWEQPKEYWDKLKKFCDYSEHWRKEEEKDIVRPKPKDIGVIHRGTTDWDVFHELSMKRLKRNGIHL